MTSKQFEIIQISLPKSKRVDEDNWTLWEHKTLNIHRAILFWSNKIDQTYIEMSDTIRNKINQQIKVSWWRGFGYGVVIEVPVMPKGIENIDISIDTRSNKNGTWQWIILVCNNPKCVIAVHTWMAGFLTPIYEMLLNSYRNEGYEVGNFKKSKDKLMKFLTKLSELKGVYYKDYEPK